MKMITIERKYLKEDGEIVFTQTNIFAPNGRFERDGKDEGWWLGLGEFDSPDNYTEVEYPGVHHEVPECLPDVVIEDDPEPEEETPND